ncbi:hypothetical protein ACFWPV_10200 [Streptomyces uncialis]|uniref:hypothetical protein n=1 Tax=Streptomyces uncialis TaxID=1048205 RepID=UPI00364CB0CF
MSRRTGLPPGLNPVRPPSPEDHVLGQIERGEVIAGREGARLIAARHEAAYGDVWDTAWTDAWGETK